MDKGIELKDLSDRQNTYLTQLSYLEISEEGRQKIAEGGLTIAELEPYLEKREEPFCDSAGVGKDVFNLLARVVMGDEKITTKGEIYDQLIASGLGDIRITDVTNDQTLLSNGFQAMAFEDSQGNVGISYRGSDLDFLNGASRDWLEADALEYFTGTSSQVEEALEYFNEHKDPNGNNYLYGHSLGGNLTQHVYLQNHNDISRAFMVNGNPINQKALDTPEKIEAFNDKEKFSFNIINGDIVGHLKSCEKYKDNITYVKNNNTAKDSIISAHLTQAASYNENDNFEAIDKDNLIQKFETFNEWQSKFESLFDFSLAEIDLSDMKKEFTDFYQDINLDEIGKTFGDFVENIDIEELCVAPGFALGHSAVNTLKDKWLDDGEIDRSMDIFDRER